MTQNGRLRPSFTDIGSYDDDHDLDTLESVSHGDISTVNDKIEAACAVNTQHYGYTAEKSGCYVSGFVGTY
jgi:hypothetical protein